MTVVPVAALGQRMPEAGRIRLGKKSDKGAPQKLQTLRFTSEHRDRVEEIAGLYGGDVTEWNPKGSRHEWQVITKAKQVPVLLPHDALSGPVYELWAGGGIVRRCDGETCVVTQQTPAGAEPADVPCVCVARGLLECQVKTRLSVLLPEIRFAGTWRLETSSKFAARELPGMVATIQGLQPAGFTRAFLGMENRTQTKEGQTRNFVVPVLSLGHTVDELVEGVSQLGALAAPARPLALPEPAAADRLFDPDDEVAEAEIVDDTAPAEATYAEPWLPLVIKMRELHLDDDARHGFAHAASHGRTTSSKELSAEEITKILDLLSQMERGEVEYTGVNPAGNATIRRRRA